MTPLHSDLARAEEIARLRAFLAAIEEVATRPFATTERDRSRIAAIRSLARDAANPTAPVPGRVAQLWREQVEGL